jgi:hypothetical protein
MAPRGLKKAIETSAPGKLIRGKFTGFRAVGDDGKPEGPMLAGITKRLSERLHSKGELEESAIKSSTWTPAAWKNNNGGLRRGSAIDAQVSRLASASDATRKRSSLFKYSKIAFSALDIAGLEPIMGQRVVLNRQKGLATACDIVCHRKNDNALVVVELKCGYSGNRTIPAYFKRKAQKLASPCSTASDCVLHRHLAQLAVTHHLLATEPGLLSALKGHGVAAIEGALLYVNDNDSQLHELPGWWKKRGSKLLTLLAAPSG